MTDLSHGLSERPKYLSSILDPDERASLADEALTALREGQAVVADVVKWFREHSETMDKRLADLRDAYRDAADDRDRWRVEYNDLISKLTPGELARVNGGI